jgi:hypothetical protein
MSGFFVCRRSIGRAVSFDEHEPRWVILLLDDIEAGDAGFLEAEPGIFERRLFEFGDGFKFYADMNVNNEHEMTFRFDCDDQS